MKPINKQPRISGLDTFRFIAALWVVFCHCGSFPLADGLDRASAVGLRIQGFYNNLFPGVPAVTVFFVISGFCIHYPYRGANTFELWPYLTRRYIRIGIPLIAAVLLAGPFHVNLSFFQDSILWSLVAELIYYTLYPFLRVLKARFGWNKILAGSFLAAFAVIAGLYPSAKDYAPSGSALSWLICLPCWLLGCRLAEEDFRLAKAAVSGVSVWLGRLLVWFAAWGCSALRYHSPVGYPWTLNVFAILVFFWLRAEIMAFRHNPPPRALEWAGKWSYSIYLMHMIAFAVLANFRPPDLGPKLNWIRMFVFVMGFSYLFYLLIEKPGHFIAKRAALFVKQREAGKTAPPFQNAPLPRPIATELVK
jgi:peptidoglycan/LPS O-acetylase OafA/YrhL